MKYDVGLPTYTIEKTTPAGASAKAAARSWGVSFLGADKVHDKANGEGHIVFVIDTEDTFTHPDVEPRNIKAYNRRYTDEDASVSSRGRHGLHVADTVRQMAPGVLLAALKALRNDGRGSSLWVANAIRGAADMALLPEHEGFSRVIVMSLGSNFVSGVIQDAVAYAAGEGCLIFAAAGNDGGDVDYPGAHELQVITSGAINKNGVVPEWSSRGPQVDLVAPGILVEAAYEGGYATISGTSMANPHTAGAGILANGLHGFSKIWDLEKFMEENAQDVPPEGFQPESGHGIPIVTNYLDSVPDDPTTPPDEGSGIPTWVWVAAGAVVVGLILYLTLKS